LREAAMADSTVKFVVLLKKKPGMSFQAFQDYYENKHSKLIKLIPRVQRYMRRYLHPLDPNISMEADDRFHVITEIYFKNRADFEYAILNNPNPDVPGILAEDEEKLFDRSQIMFYTVDERETDLAAG